MPIVHDDEVLVSFEVADGYTADVREAIASGLRTTFTYEVQLRMVVPAWVDRTIVTSIIGTSDQYDNLTRRHSLSRSVDGRVVESIVTEDETVVREWLTQVNRLRLCRTSRLERNRDYYVRVNARLRPQGSSVFGWANVISGLAKFTFVP